MMRADGVARIGPNAILQLVPVLDGSIGLRARQALFDVAKVALPSSDAGMLPQDQVIRLHRAVAEGLPGRSPALLRAAGLATADYILANRIPAPAKRLIRMLPAPLGARLLAKAIARHAWTFAGSGVFRIEGYHPLILSIAANPLAVCPICHWHAAVFERLFSTLTWPRVKVVERGCCAKGDAACRFEITPQTLGLLDSTM